ncbi:hypothetical protein [Bradyrhizobium uaiense]|uniref:Uncharacterized protein n=1 Tax=Bradyrhizobium uaiense TaxID=2594946 RepID=A0A6P1BQG4_9BRAD|nr:hypothetical protein [Bradyrhizobium uaiense]NEV00485.1 hypothetical protein [Bradyrhizobium uaiense]
MTAVKCEPSELVEIRRSVAAPFGRGPGTTETFCSIIEPSPPFSTMPMPGEAKSFRSIRLVATLESTAMACAPPFAMVTTSPTAIGSWLGKRSLALQCRCTLIKPSTRRVVWAGERKSLAPVFSARL